MMSRAARSVSAVVALALLAVAALALLVAGLLPTSTASTLPATAGEAAGASPAASSPWRSGGPYGGNVQALALSPDFRTDGFALVGGWRQGPYGVTGGYGIARTTDAGSTWELLGDEQHRWPVFEVAVSPAFGVDRTAFAGTDVGLLRTTDRGDTWAWLYNGLPSPVHGESGPDDISRVRISPAYATDGTVFALQRELQVIEGKGTVADAHLFRSTDRGDSWTRILGGVSTAVGLSRDFATDGTLYAAVHDGAATILQRSTDRGGTWFTAFGPMVGHVSDILALPDGSLLLAADDGVARLVWQSGALVLGEVTEAVAGAVNRLASAGDHVYAAGEEGLFISLTEGRTWQRYGDTPAVPFRAVAPCPLWGSCHSLMAGAYTGILFTPDDNLEPWRWLSGPQPLVARSVAASPSYDAGDGTLFAGTEGGVFRSTDRGQSWRLMVAGDPPGDDYSFNAVRISPAYASDGTVFASYESRILARTALYRSTDRGETWTVFPAVAGGSSLAISPNYPADRTVFFGRGDRLHKSTDGGVTWDSYPITPVEDPVLNLAVSPAYASDRTLFVSGFNGVRRSTDGGVSWQAMSTYGPAYDVAVSPDYQADGTVWHTYRAIESAGDGTPEGAVVRSVNRGGAWSLVAAGLPGVYEPFPWPLAVSPRFAADATLFTALYGQPVAGSSRTLYRSIDGGDWWTDLGTAPGNPNVFDLEATGHGPDAVAVHLATSAGVWHYESLCEERLVNGGFEVLDEGWQLPTTPATAVYSTKRSHGGQQSMRAGIDGGTNVYSYSSANQTVAIPARARSATLKFWWYPISGEGSLAAGGAAPDAAQLRLVAAASSGDALPAREAVLPGGAASSDRQYVLVIDAKGNILRSLVWTRSDARAWQELSFDLSEYRGHTIRLAFGAYNDGSGGSTAMYVDDASLTICWPALPAPTATPSVTPSVTPTSGVLRPRVYLPIALHRYVLPLPPTATLTVTGTPSVTASPPSPTPTWTPGALRPRWLISLVAAPGEEGRLYGVTNEGHLMSSSDRGEEWETLMLPVGAGGGRVRARFVGIDYAQPQVLHLTTSEGLWRSTDAGTTWERRSSSSLAQAVTVSFTNADALWGGAPAPVRSTDAGLTWTSAAEGFAGALVSPILIDPGAPNMLYAVGQQSPGAGGLFRRPNGMWEQVANAPLGSVSDGLASPGIAFDSGQRALYVGRPDGVLSVSRNVFTPALAEVSWQAVHTFEHQPIPLAVGTGPHGASLYVSVNDYDGDLNTPGLTLRSDDGGANWTPLIIPAPAGAPTATPTPTATTTRTPPVGPTLTPVACYSGLLNGGFETDEGWMIRSNPVLAAYVTSPVHSGQRSMRTGIAPGGANVTSYSPIEQTIEIPEALASARLSFWRYNINGDVSALGASHASAVDPRLLPRTEADLADSILATDFFYVIAIRADGSIDWLLTESVNTPWWRWATFDLSRYRGQRIRLQFGAYNGGSGGISRTFVDDVSLEICPPAGALVLSAGWVRQVIGSPDRSSLYADVAGALYRSDDAGATWRRSGTARPEPAILGASADVIYAGQGGSCYEDQGQVPVWRTTDSGASWHELPAASRLKPLAAHPSLPWLYFGGCGGPAISKDGGATVTVQPDPLFQVFDVRQLAPVLPDWATVWAGGVSEGGGGAVLVSRNGGGAWSRSTPLSGELGWLGDLALDRFAPGGILAAASQGFFRSIDDGQTWTEESAGLADVIDPGAADRPYGLLALAQDPGVPDHRLYLGSVRGLYVREAASGVWYKVAGRPYDAEAVSDLLVLDGAPDRLYVTTSSGVYVHDLRSTLPRPTATPTASPTATPVVAPTAPTQEIPTAPAGSWPTPQESAGLALGVGSSPHGIALSPSGDAAFVALHGTDHEGRDLAFVEAEPLRLERTLRVSSEASGPNGVAIVPAGDAPLGYLVAVSQRQTDEVVIVDPADASVQRRLAVGDMPDGVVAQGQHLYVANFGDGSVSVFRTATWQLVSTLAVGEGPALFASDEAGGDVYLSLHGANRVVRLRDGSIVETYAGILAPYGMAFDPTERRLYVANRGAHHTVTVVDVAAGNAIGAIDVGAEPYVVAVNPDTGHLFVTCGDRVQVRRTLDWQPVISLPAPAGAEEGVAVDSRRDRIYVTSRAGNALTVIQDGAAPLVLFTSDRDGNSELYRMLPDGRAQTRLTTTTGAAEVGAAGSPDGRWIAYSRRDGDDGESRLWLMSRNGRNARMLSSGGPEDISPTWSPDGEALAFASYRGDNWDIYRLNLATGLLVRLTSGAAADLAPDWSWANGRIAFQSDRNAPNAELFTMAADGSDVRQLTVNPNGDAEASWNPTGEQLVFWGSRSEQTLYRAAADGSSIAPLISRALRPSMPQWGPGAAGGWIAFTGYRPGSGHSEVLRTSTNGNGLVLLTDNEVDFDAATGWLPGTP